MKKIVLISLLTLFSLSFTYAQQQFRLPLWTGSDAPEDASDAYIDVFLAPNPNGKFIVVCPGGGYAFLSNVGLGSAHWLNKYGISTCALHYRLPKGRHDVPLKDAEQAIRIVRNHAKEWKVDEVGIMGTSAGGHLTGTVATIFTSEDTRPDFQILYYPVITMDKSFTHAGSRHELIGDNASKELEEKYSCEKQVRENSPRAFIVVSATDKVVPVKNSLVYAQALRDKGVPVSLHVYPYGKHGFGYNYNFKDGDAIYDEVINWIFENYDTRKNK